MNIVHKTEEKIIHNYVETRECDCYVVDLEAEKQIRFDHFSPEDLGSKNVHGFEAKLCGGNIQLIVYVYQNAAKPGRYDMSAEYLIQDGTEDYHRSWDEGDPIAEFSKTIEAGSAEDAFCLYAQDNLEALRKTIKESN